MISMNEFHTVLTLFLIQQFVFIHFLLISALPQKLGKPGPNRSILQTMICIFIYRFHSSCFIRVHFQSEYKVNSFSSSMTITILSASCFFFQNTRKQDKIKYLKTLILFGQIGPLESQ